MTSATRSQPLEQAIDRLADDPRLDRLRPILARWADLVAPPGPRRELLRGRDIGQPLHPVLVDLPIGFFTAATTLDLVGGRRSRTAAQRMVAWGIVCAVPAFLSGWAEWSDADDESQRIGIAHAAVNAAAVSTYALSWRARHRGHHLRGVALGLVGGTIATAGAHLGGHLAFVRGIGQRRAHSTPTRHDPPVPNAKLGPSDGTTLTEVLDDYERAGFTHAFLLGDGGTLRCRSCSVSSSASSYALHSLRRLEGASDPADMVAVAAVTCPSCHVGGTIVLRYGPEASEDETLVYLALDDHRGDVDGLPAAAAPGEGQTML
jgi:uncharacterized membrane protein